MKFKLRKKILPALIAATISTVGYVQVANAQDLTSVISADNASGTAPSLFVPQWDSATLTTAGCDPNVMTRLTNDYIKKRGTEQQVQAYQAKQLFNGAPAKAASCYASALNNINNALAPVKKLIALYEGSSGDVMSAIGGVVAAGLTRLACSEASNYTNSLSYGLTSSINSVQLGDGYTIGTVSSTVNSSINANGSINSTYIGNSVVNQATPIVNSSTSGLSSMNPFK